MTQCKDDPRAPHGFLRNESHNAHEYVCECEHWQSPFEQWYNGMVGFHINSERILEDLNYPLDYNQTVNPETVRKWMIVCWNNALDAAQKYNGVDVEVLKEPLDKTP